MRNNLPYQNVITRKAYANSTVYVPRWYFVLQHMSFLRLSFSVSRNVKYGNHARDGVNIFCSQHESFFLAVWLETRGFTFSMSCQTKSLKLLVPIVAAAVGVYVVKEYEYINRFKSFSLDFSDLIHKEFNVLPHSLLYPSLSFPRILWVRIKNSDTFFKLPFTNEKYYSQKHQREVWKYRTGSLGSIMLCFYLRDSLLPKYFDDLMIWCLLFFSLNPRDYYQKNEKNLPTTKTRHSDNETQR